MKNSLNATKRIKKKAFLEPKLLNFKRCSFVPTKISHSYDNLFGITLNILALLLTIFIKKTSRKSLRIFFYRMLNFNFNVDSAL